MAGEPDPTTTVTWGDPGGMASVPAWLVTSAAGSVAVRVYALLSLYVGMKPPTKQEMVVTLNVSDRALQNALDELVAVGAITKPSPRAYRLLLEQGAVESKPAALPVLRTSDANTPPPITKVDGRNLPLDAICLECDIADGSARIPAAVAALNGRRGGKGITHLFWLECRRVAALQQTGGMAALAQLQNDSERYGRLLAHEVRSKAALIRRKQPWREQITPALLRDLWLDVELMPDPARQRGMTPDEIRAAG